MVWTNSTNPDQTASAEAAWSGSSLFAILTSIFVNFSLDNQQFIWEQNKKKDIFFVNFSLDIQLFIWEQNKKSVRNLVYHTVTFWVLCDQDHPLEPQYETLNVLTDTTMQLPG